jgi:ABC-2 type transport system permease protein
VSFAEAVAYRAELFVWILTSTMPLIMLALWTAVARDAPVGRYDQRGFVAYFLAVFVVRQLTGAWIAWEMNHEIRQGTIAARLLRPVPPILHYAAETLAAVPLRLIVALPVAGAVLWVAGRGQLPRGPAAWGAWLAALAGAWLIAFLMSFCIGCLAFYLESSAKFMDLSLVLLFVFSGYLFPVELLPAGVRVLADWLPFRYQIGLPVELLVSAPAAGEAASRLAAQWAWVVALLGAATALWRGGLSRYAAYGG